jgi:hypothetical protein
VEILGKEKELRLPRFKYLRKSSFFHEEDMIQAVTIIFLPHVVEKA